MWLFARFLFSAVRHYALAPLRALWRWLWRDWRHPPLLALAVTTAVHIFIVDPGLRSDLAEARKSAAAEIEAHNGTIADFWLASHQAEQAQQDNAARVRTEQTAITERIEHGYQTRLARLHVRHRALADSDTAARAVPGRMRKAAPAIDPGASGPAGLPGSGSAPGSLAGAPEDRGLPDDWRLIASEQALQLDALIDWVEEQAAVQTSPEAETAP